MSEMSFSPNEINVSPDALSQLRSILEDMGDDAVGIVGLRVFVTGGGCSGFQYGFSFAQTKDDDDAMFTTDGINIVVDPLSYQYLVGATVDFKTDIHGSQFTLQNPNATSGCGCGKSFTV